MRDQQSHHRPGHVEELSGQRALHVEVEGAGAVEAGRDVDLQQPGLQLGVQQNVKPKQLEAGVSASHVVVVETDQTPLCTDDSLYHQVFDLLPDGGVINPGGVKVPPERFQGPLVSL